MSDVGAKVRYVMGQGQTRDHRCHWPDCPEQVPPAKWGCGPHWGRLPAELRAEIWRTFQPGQEINGTPSREYVEVARRVQEWIRLHGEKAKPEPASWKPPPMAPAGNDAVWDRILASPPATKLIQCSKCKGWRYDLGGPHAPHSGEGPPGYGPAMVDCCGDVIEEWPWPDGKPWP